MGDRARAVGRKAGGCCAPFRGSSSNTTSPGQGLPPYQVVSWSIQPFGHNRYGPKVGVAVGSIKLWSPSNNVAWSEVYFPTKWHLDPSRQPFGYNRYGRQLGVCPFWGRGAGSPSNIMWPEPKPTSIPSGILIHATIWPQYTNVTDRTDRQRSESDSIRWTVLQTVAPKLAHYENYRIDSSRIL